MGEQWRPVPGWDGVYEVSDQGRVRSLDRVLTTATGQRNWRGRVHRLDTDKDGYPCIKLGGANGKRAAVHQLVMAAFVGPRPQGQEVRHLNDIRDDNRLANLAYGTRSDNMYDCIRNGSHNRASRDKCCRGHEFKPETMRIRINKANGRTFRYCMICDRIRRQKE